MWPGQAFSSELGWRSRWNGAMPKGYPLLDAILGFKLAVSPFYRALTMTSRNYSVAIQTAEELLVVHRPSVRLEPQCPAGIRHPLVRYGSSQCKRAAHTVRPQRRWRQTSHPHAAAALEFHG